MHRKTRGTYAAKMQQPGRMMYGPTKHEKMHRRARVLCPCESGKKWNECHGSTKVAHDMIAAEISPRGDFGFPL